MCDEQTIKEIEALRVALDDFSAKKESTMLSPCVPAS